MGQSPCLGLWEFSRGLGWSLEFPHMKPRVKKVALQAEDHRVARVAQASRIFGHRAQHGLNLVWRVRDDAQNLGGRRLLPAHAGRKLNVRRQPFTQASAGGRRIDRARRSVASNESSGHSRSLFPGNGIWGGRDTGLEKPRPYLTSRQQRQNVGTKIRQLGAICTTPGISNF
jgi:hypothetical protein